MVDVSVDSSDAQRRIREAIRAVPAAGRVALTRAGAFHVRAMARRFVPYGSGSAAGFGGFLQHRSNALRRTFKFLVEGSGGEQRALMYSERPANGRAYGRVQEFGGTITPRTRQFLTVPLPAALTAGGVLKGGARIVERDGRYYTADGKRTVLFVSKRGNAIIASTSGEGRRSKLTPLYVLRKSVKLKPRLGFVRTFRDRTAPFFREELARQFGEVLG